MQNRLRSHLPTLLAALIAGTAVAVGPTIAQAAYDAVNADKVDGKSAVGATASPAKRAGKLVATDRGGMLPDDIIGTAQDADRLDGLDSTGYVQGRGHTGGFTQTIPPGPGSQSAPFDLPGIPGPVRLLYFCPANPMTEPTAFYLFNHSSSAIGVYVSRGAGPTDHETLSAGGGSMSVLEWAEPYAGDIASWTIVQPSSGRVATVQTTSLRTNAGCTVSAQALTTIDDAAGPERR